jgi:glycosyltransferase involved in cell wall biosynthesis
MNIVIVVQRYGKTIVGGGEAHAYAMAHLLARRHQVTVVTTAASDYETWRNDLQVGEEPDGAVRVLRFRVERERSLYWHELNRLLHGTLGHSMEFATLRAEAKAGFGDRLAHWPVGLQEEYVRWQGPYSPELFAWLRENGALHDRFLFFTYLYPTTYFGMPCVPEEKIDFVPTLHDEPPAYLPAFGRCFRAARRILFNTVTEQRLAERLYAISPGAGEVLGYGMEEPPGDPVQPAAAGEAPFLLYAGRIDVNKGIPALCDHFLRWTDEHPRNRLELVLIGSRLVDLPEHPAIVYRGFVSAEEKGMLMRRALALVHPSPFESLGLVILEAFLCGTPALVFGKNEVLVEHCRLSNGGLWYDDYPEFAEALSWLLRQPEAAKVLGTQGRAYAREHYGLEAYLKRVGALYPARGDAGTDSVSETTAALCPITA